MYKLKTFDELSLNDKIFIFSRESPFPAEAEISRLEKSIIELTIIVESKNSRYLFITPQNQNICSAITEGSILYLTPNWLTAIKHCINIVKEERVLIKSREKKLDRLEELLRKEI